MMKMGCRSRVFVLAIVLLFCFYNGCESTEVSYDGRAIKIDGERRILISGSIHYPRSTEEMWPSLIRKAKDGGLNTIETYVFWNAHEPQPGQYDFSGNLNFIKFLKTIQEAGLYAILRIGPYVCAEWNYGGLPVWLYNSRPNMKFRTYNQDFMNEMQRFTTLIVDMVKAEKLFAPDGGPIILAQIENEYGNVMNDFGEDGKKYINWCANMAVNLNIGVPWIMCQQRDSPDSVIDTCNGHYCDQFYPTRKTIPKLWTENWTGWFSGWGDKNIHRPAEDVAFAVARFYQLRGTLQNYYMYHGGTNFGRTSGGPWIITSYDYDAPLDEYGLVNEPKWGHLKQLHQILVSVEKILTYGDFNDVSYGGWKYQATSFNYNGTRVCFFGNADTNPVSLPFEGRTYDIPAWSCSIYFNDCITEVYNSARVTAQASTKVKEVVPMDNSATAWTWRYEKPEQLPTKLTRGYIKDKLILDQKRISNDTSDYVWYMTSVEYNESSPIWGESVTLQVTSTGNVLHVWVNNKSIASQPARYWSTFNFEINLNPGRNVIVLLSATVGLQNYGSFYESGPNGIAGQPIKLIAPNNQQIDLSSNTWIYKVGLNGFREDKLYDDNGLQRNWNTGAPVNKELVWYKRYFTTPPGDDPVVLDLGGMGKGTAWVNGHNLGRYWPASFAPVDGCNGCDYRGNYNHNKCFTECGNSTQRWYHVPRSFLLDGEDNSLVLFEEMGGNPLDISIQTVSLRTIYAASPEGSNLELSCHGKKISGINFASFGTNDTANSTELVKQACLGKESCSIEASEKTFGQGPLENPNTKKMLAVEGYCS